MEFKNFSVLKSLVLEEILGDGQSLKLSHELGFKFDQYKRWQNNDKILKWDEFVKICEVKNLDLKGSLSFMSLIQEVPFETFFQYLKRHCAFETNADMAKYLNCHQSVVQRYLKGETVPDFESILKLLGKHPNTISIFLKNLFSSQISNPMLNAFVEADLKKINAKNQHHLGFVVCYLIQFKTYKTRTVPSDVWLAEKLKIDLSELQGIVESLISTNMIKREGDDLINLVKENHNLTGLPREQIIPSVMYLNQKVLSILEGQGKNWDVNKRDNHPGGFTFAIGHYSSTQMSRINDVIFKAGEELSAIVNDDSELIRSEPKTEIRGVLFQTFNIAVDK